MRATYAIILVLLLSACSSAPPKETIFTISRAELDSLKLAYYSDYFSFVGWDELGPVAFAIDNNRGQDGESWQAEHFVVLYDAQSGWQAPSGNGAYDNSAKSLEQIPDSDYFTFSGDVSSGMVISSAVNGLHLELEQIKPVIDNARGLSAYRLGSAAATLHWNERTLKGRVIHEYLFLPAFNRLTRTYFGVFDDFHGVYAAIDQRGDFYFHSQKSDFLVELTGYDEGFIVLNGTAVALNNFSPRVEGRRQGRGFYRWPLGWSGTFSALAAQYQFDLRIEHQSMIANWVIGGFAMGIVQGDLKKDGVVLPVFGIGELIM